jgi:site-specific DNA recombinase
MFAMHLCEMSTLKIKAALETEAILSPAGKSTWSKRTIDMILSNKKYCGSFVVKGGGKSYECVNHHEPIILLDLFERVQTAKAERTNIEIGEDGRKLRRSTKYSSQKTQEKNSLSVTLLKHFGRLIRLYGADR